MGQSMFVVAFQVMPDGNSQCMLSVGTDGVLQGETIDVAYDGRMERMEYCKECCYVAT